jgi:hypothetical protein
MPAAQLRLFVKHLQNILLEGGILEISGFLIYQCHIQKV